MKCFGVFFLHLSSPYLFVIILDRVSLLLIGLMIVKKGDTLPL